METNMTRSRKAVFWTASAASVLAFASADRAAAQYYPGAVAYGAPVYAPYAEGPRPIVVRRAVYGGEYRWPYRPDLIVRMGPPGGKCTLTYEQTLTADGLAWRPLVDCEPRD
jgi:hypothetical protein